MTSPTLALFDMTGRNAIVTGGAGLLGRQFADGLADAGAMVFLVDLPGPRLDGVVAELARRHGPRVRAIAADITVEAAAEKAVAQVAAEGGVHALVNSAAIDAKFETGPGGTDPDNGAFPSYSPSKWSRSLVVNLTGTFLMTRAATRAMEATGKGAVVNISSTYGLAGPDQRIYEAGDLPFFKPVDYATTKAGVLGFTRAVAAYYRGTSIRVNALVPGGALNNHDPKFVDAYASRTIMGRMAMKEEYRAPILFLCSDASSYMTGASLVVDGGWTAW